MAAILKLRRGTSLTSIQQSELFYNTTLGTIFIGDGGGTNTTYKTLVKLNESNSGSLHLLSDITGSHISASGDIYASSIELTGDATIGGNIVLAGNIFLGDGDNSSDNVSINSSFSGSFLPTADAVFTLGTPSKRYLDIRVVSASIEHILLPGSGILSSSVSNFTDYSQSVDNRLDVEEAKSVTLQTVTSSLDTRLDTEEAKSLTLATVTSSYDIQLSNLEITSASHDSRLDVEEAKSLILQTVTSSYDGRLSNLQLTSQSHDLRLDNIELTTQSLDNRIDQLETDTGSQDNRLDNLEITSASHDTRLDIEEAKSVTLSTVTSSFDSRLDIEEAKSVTLETVTSSFDDRLDQIEVVTSSLASTYEEKSSSTHILVSGSSQVNADTITNFDSNVKTKLDDEAVVSGSSQVNFTQLSGISNNIISSSTDSNQVDMVISGGSISANLKGGVVSGSIQILGGSTILSSSVTNFTNYSSSVDSRLDTIEGPFSTSVDTRLDSLEGDIHTHSNKTQLDTINQNLSTTSDVTFNTGSFTGNMTITGDLIVLGDATEIQTTELKIQDKLITVASGSADSAAADGAGIEIDGANKSLQWDHNSTSFVFDALVSSSVGFKGEGGELTGIDTAQVTEASNLYYTDARVKTKLNSEGVVSGSAQVTSDLDLRYLEIDGDSVISGSSQVNYSNLSGINNNIVSASTDTSRVNFTITDGNISADLIGGVVSGSSQVTGDLDIRYESIGNGIVSGSSQISSDQTTGWIVDVRKQIDNVGLVSSSVQINANTITNFDTNVSDKLGVDNVHSGSFLGSATTANLSENTNLYYTDARVKTKLDAETVVSGSSQISAKSTTGWIVDVKKELDDNTVISGSSQVNANTITNFDTNVSDKLGVDNVHSGSFLGTSTTSDLSEGTNLYYTDARVKTKLDAETVISGSTFSSPSQGTVRATINGANTDIDTGLQTGDSPTFTTLTLSTVASGGSSDFDALFNVGGLFKKRTIGTAAFLNVSASISDDPNSIPTTKAVNDALISAGAGDITSVNSTSTVSPSVTGIVHTETGTSDAGAYGNTGATVIAVATGSNHFTDGVVSVLPTGLISGSSQLTTEFDARYGNELGDGLISSSLQLANSTVSNESLNTETGSISTAQGVQDQRLTAIESVSGSFLTGTIDISSGTNLAVSDTSNVDMILTGDTLSANLKGGVVSGSSQITITESQISDLVHYTDSNVKTKLDADGVVSGSILNSQLANDSVTYIAGDGLTGGGSTALGSSASINVVGGDGITVNVHNIEINSTILRKLGDSVISGSSQVIIASVNGFSAISTSLDDRIDTLEGDVHENVLTFSDTSTIDLNRSTNTITANVIGGIFSGSSQIAAGGDLSGNVNSLTVGSVQGVALTSGEATQIANIGSNTISATQWGYVGGANQALTNTSDVTFASASLSNVTITGNLAVLGDSVAINVSDLKIEDKLITVASGSADSAAADGAGIEIAGANESITWNHANTRFNISDDIHVTGTIKATDDIIAFSSSDRELKNNIIPITNALEKINRIGGYSFDWNVDKQDIYKGKDIGVIAQEIEEILPQLVHTRESGYKAVKYDKLVSLLIEGIKDLSKEVEELKRKIDN